MSGPAVEKNIATACALTLVSPEAGERFRTVVTFRNEPPEAAALPLGPATQGVEGGGVIVVCSRFLDTL